VPTRHCTQGCETKCRAITSGNLVHCGIAVLDIKSQDEQIDHLCLQYPFLPMLLSAFIGLISFGVLDFRFIIIDTYLFVFFVVLASYAKSLTKNPYQERFLDRLMIPWSLAGAVNIIAGGFGYLTGRVNLFGSQILKYGRLTGFFKDPNVLGPFLILVSAYFLMQFLKARRNELLNFALFLFFSFGILLTFSRAAWLNYAVTTILLVGTTLLNRSTRSKALSFFVIAVLVLFVFWYSADKIDLLGANLGDFILTRLGLQHYDLERFEAQRKFVDILSFTNAFFGIGPGNYELYSRMATHSLYARYIGERGLFGVSLFVLFWALVLREVFNPRDKNLILLVKNEWGSEAREDSHRCTLFTQMEQHSVCEMGKVCKVPVQRSFCLLDNKLLSR